MTETQAWYGSLCRKEISGEDTAREKNIEHLRGRLKNLVDTWDTYHSPREVVIDILRQWPLKQDFGGASDFCKPKKDERIDIRGRGVGDLPWASWESFPPSTSKR